MKLKILENQFAICRLNTRYDIPLWALSQDTFSITRIAGEISVICREECVPDDIVSEKGFRFIQVVNIQPINQIGIIAGVSDVLKKAEISILSMSTYNTDYFLVKEDEIVKAVRCLRNSGYSFV